MEEIQKKSNKGLIVLVIILIILLLSAISYICYDMGVFDSLLGKDKSVEEPKKEEKLSEEEIMKLHDNLMIQDSDLYLKNSVNIDTISSFDLISYVLIEYSKKNGINLDNEINVIDCGSASIADSKEEYDDNKIHLCKYDDSKEDFVSVSKDSVVSISKNDIDREIKSLFNTDRSFEISDHTEYYGNQADPVFVYSKDDNKFYLVNHQPLGEWEIYSANNKLLKFEQEDNKVYIYDKVVRCMGFVCYKTQVYGDNSDIVLEAKKRNGINVTFDSNILEKNTGKDLKINFEYIFDKYSNLFNTYKTTFKKASDGNYYWYSSEIVNE